MAFILSMLTPLITPFVIILIALILLLEQIIYLKKKSYLPGPSLVFPFFGNIVSVVTNPTKFWNVQSSFAKCNSHGFSANYMMGKFVIYIQSTDLSHKVFNNVRPDAFHFIGHPFGKKLFGEHNLIYMFGQEHKDLRRRIAYNFTPKTLATYTAIQQKIIIKHLKLWLDIASEFPNEPIPLRHLCRDMNLEISRGVFVGPYLKDECIEQFNVDYNYFNVGLMKLPVDLPGFAFRNARLAVGRLIDTLSVCAEQSQKNMISKEKPTCLIDFWMQESIREFNEKGTKCSDLHKPFDEYTTEELGGYLFDFLFAAQDASTSSLLWAVVLLDSHPQALERVRAEVSKFWSPEFDQPLTAEMLREMKYVEAVAREVLRIRPPATSAPHVAGEEFRLTNDYVIPKGTLVFPSITDSSFQGFREPEKFNPDRFMEERQEDRVYRKNFLVFGTGVHVCVGQRYAINQLMLFIAMFTALIDFKRHKTDGCDDLSYTPTIVPKDDCKVFLSSRCTRFPLTKV